MCLRIETVDLAAEAIAYDPATITIHVRRDAQPVAAVAEIHAILSDLDAPAGLGAALCFCGEPITLPPPLLAAQHGRAVVEGGQVLRGA
ncbi:hypothetical protein ACIQOW_08560 [Kitasatospora sp. NPDC091335]|uniref:hypothetical protein n=1 Tax=Kitasatospora sp. NPDC091335 TaxID=3364085 RepID=UPI0038303298